MENVTEPISEEATAIQKQKLEELRKYNRDYYHAHKKASECEHCKKTFSSVSALRRHQGKNLNCKLLQATETIEKFKQSG
jgi:hypothetical protein